MGVVVVVSGRDVNHAVVLHRGVVVRRSRAPVREETLVRRVDHLVERIEKV